MIRKTLFVLKLIEIRMRFIAVLVVMGLIVGYWERISTFWDHWTRPAHAPAPAGDVEYFCPMHPQVVRAEPGNCPICGMTLSKRKKGEKEILPAGVVGRVLLSPLRVQMAGIRTAEVGYRPLFRTIETTGDLDTDERRLSRIVSRTAGRADTVFADFVGAHVDAGAPLLDIYSPDLLTGREEYVNELKAIAEAPSPESAATSRRLAKATRERLLLWGLTKEQIDALKPGQEVDIHVTVESPISGTVISKHVQAGQEVAAGEVLYEVADLSSLWLQLHVLEDDIALVKPGQTVDVTAVALPGESFGGTVTFVDPIVDSATRSARARVEVPNPDAKLKPGMAVTARLGVPVAPAYEAWHGCCEQCPEMESDKPGKCPKCGMEMVRRDPAVIPLAKDVYRCAMDGGERDTPGPCPKCGMNLGAESLVKAAPAKALYRCAMDGGERDTPGPCPKCGMPLGEESRVQPEVPGTKTVWVCEMHPDHVHDKPGESEPCTGGPDVSRKIEPGSRLVYRCPEHTDQKSDKPGACPVCGRPLAYRIESDPTRFSEQYGCPNHTTVFQDHPGKCRVCGTELVKVKVPEVLAVPFLAVIDTGSRKVVWVDKGGGLFEGVEVKLGARAGDFYPVLSGLAAGDKVAAAGAFLIDAENGLNPSASAAYFGASDQPAGGGGK